MSEKSYFHNGLSTGDAVLAPYHAQLFSSILRNLYGREGLIIPATSFHELEVIGKASRSLDVYQGWAFIQGVLYHHESDETISLATNVSPYPRIDRVVVRIDWITQEVTLDVLQGIPATIPDLPAVKQSLEDVYELPIAWVYLPSGYTTTSNRVVDERHFAATALYQENYVPHNFIGNGCFMGFSGERLASSYPPDMWDLYNGGAVTPDSITSVENAELEFGRAIKITTDQYGGLSQTTLIPNGNHLITTRVLIQVESGEVYVGSYGNGSLVYPTQEIVEVLIRDYRTGVGGHENEIAIFANEDATTFTVYQVTSTYGHIEVTFIEEHEIILFDYTVINSDGFTAGTTYSTSTVTVTTEDWPNSPDIKALLTGARAAIFKLGVLDSGSVGSNDCGVAIRDTKNHAVLLRTVVGGLTNNTYRETVGIVPLEEHTPNADDAFEFELDIIASGANTLRIQLEIVGVIV